MISLASAQGLSTRIITEIAPFCSRLEVAGSVRRRRPFVGDIDIVAEPLSGGIERLRERVKRSTKVIKDGPQTLVVELANGVQLDLWLARPAESDLLDSKPGNFASLLLCRTGSMQHNIFLIEHAKRMGLIWNPYAGVLEGERLIAWESELAIFEALKLAFVPPERRER